MIKWALLLSGLWWWMSGTMVQAQEIVQDTVTNEADTVPLDEQRVVGVQRPGNVAPPDTVTIEMVAPDHSPRRAALYSAVLPGLGQVYNKKYWKLPIIYGGFAILTSIVVLRNDQYRLLRRALIAEQRGQPEFNALAGTEGERRVSQLNVDNTRQQRDQFAIYAAAWYALNIMDAIVDAHLIEFDVNPDLSLNLEPTVGPRLAYQTAVPTIPYAGIAFTLHIK